MRRQSVPIVQIGRRSRTRSCPPYLALQVELDSGWIAKCAAKAKAELLKDALHLTVLRQHIGDHAIQMFVAANLDQPAEQLGAEPLAMQRVAYDGRELTVVGTGHL